MDKFTYLNNTEVTTIEELYKTYKKNPDDVEESWRRFFEGFEFARKTFGEDQTQVFEKEFNVINLIEAYRKRGHLFTETNPVRTRRQYTPTLALENYGLSEEDRYSVFQAGSQIGIGPATLNDILDHLKQTYCRSIGAEYMFIRKPEILSWLSSRMEKEKNTPAFSIDEKKHIYQYLNRAVNFEQFIHKKFIGQKRFSLEGGEALIPSLDAVLEKGAELGIEEFIIGMSHRGRLNVLANILKKPIEDIFSEFTGKFYEENIQLGDVKYHLGYGSTIKTESNGDVRLNLAPNPSHLEAADPVVEGIARAKIDHKYQGDSKKLAPILIHGDAAIAAQGVVYEVIQMSMLNGYKTGGTIHLVINNQVGFTTNYLDGRSSTYSTDIGKVTKAPIFHVNGDDVEALVYTVKLAMEFRQIFHHDVFIDILCYRKYGHNEADEPRFTQPLLYKAIASHPNPAEIYANNLIDQKIYAPDDIKTFNNEFNQQLEEKMELAKKDNVVHIQRFLDEDWHDYKYPENEDFLLQPATGVSQKILKDIGAQITKKPEKKIFRKLEKLLQSRRKILDNHTVDWPIAELLAYGSLIYEGNSVRLAGQDSERGTFSHRHAAFHYEESEKKYTPLKYLYENQPSFEVYNSLLSEYGALGFEYGYALATPKSLTIWEAQYGDFVNMAQVIIDQYISSAEEKWGLLNGLVLFLPHGYEGQGPEHSNARIERFLSLAARNNMQIVNCTTPANFFHVLRRQLSRDFRVPLVIFTPKSLLRHPKCISKLEYLEKGSFQKVFDDDNTDTEEVRRVVFCSGKIYYDLLEKKEEWNSRDIALIRIEELHPFPNRELKYIIDKYKNALIHLWVQEEPENMGPWSYVKNELKNLSLIPVARTPSGSPATGLSGLHNIGQNEIISKVFRTCTCELKNKYCGLQCVEGKSRKEILKQHYYFDSKFSI